MSEPPIVPNSSQTPNDNPFAPSSMNVSDTASARINLDGVYWIASALLVFGSAAIGLFSVPLCVPCLFVSIAAVVRVPLLQRSNFHQAAAFSVMRPNPPSPILLLLTSLFLNVTFLCVSAIAFVVVCVPGTISLGDLDNAVLGASAFIALLSYLFLFLLSLRLRF